MLILELEYFSHNQQNWNFWSLIPITLEPFICCIDVDASVSIKNLYKQLVLNKLTRKKELGQSIPFLLSCSMFNC